MAMESSQMVPGVLAGTPKSTDTHSFLAQGGEPQGPPVSPLSDSTVTPLVHISMPVSEETNNNGVGTQPIQQELRRINADVSSRSSPQSLDLVVPPPPHRPDPNTQRNGTPVGHRGNANTRDDERTPLVPREQNNNECTRKIALCRFTVTLLLIIAGILCIVGLVMIILAAVPPETISGNTLVAREDYVYLYYTTNGHMTHDIAVTFTLQNVTNPSLETVFAIYKIHCDELHTLYDSRPFEIQETVSSFPNIIPLFPLSKVIPIRNCSDYAGICILNQYVYIVNTDPAVLIYNITLIPFKRGETKVRIVVFDNLKYFRSFLNGEGIGNAIRTKTIESANYEFVITSPEMRRPSYYFVAIEDVDDTAQWFAYTREGLDVFYDASKLNPDCYLNRTNGYKCTIEIFKSSEENCFLAHIEGPKPDEPVYIDHKATNLKRSYFGRMLFYFGWATVIVSVTMAICVICYIYKRMSC